ncbi:MAG: SDR family NAD(P)-dependent oxidoreductase, partial [Gammaproteobacteria bacterium]|nr:SDR family NAD(P)-dependent oxidoreductase [Gammaproteobacteria bacterium]
EVEALTESFRQYTDKTQYCALGSVKSNIGHTLTAAGIASVIKTLLCLQHKKLVPTINFQDINEHIDIEHSPFYVNTELKDWQRIDNQPRLAAVSAFGFSGTNVHTVLQEAPQQTLAKQRTTLNKPYYLIALSAKSEDALQQKIVDLYDWLSNKKHLPQTLSAISYTLNACRTHFNYRRSLVVSSIDELRSLLEKIKNNSQQNYLNVFVEHVRKRPADAAIYKKVLKASLEELTQVNYGDSKSYKDTLASLANLYVKGYHVDWQLLHQGEVCQNILLPTYPFAKERYWLSADTAAHTKNRHQAMTQRLHPLVHHNVSDISGYRYQSVLSAADFALSEHVVLDKAILPGVAHIECMCFAGELANPSHKVIGLSDVFWALPLSLDGDTVTMEIQLSFDKAATQARVCTVDSTQAVRQHGQAKLIYAEQALVAPPPLDIESIRKRCDKYCEHDELYQWTQEAGFGYGPRFRCVERVDFSQEEALVTVQLPAFAVDEVNEYRLHPGIFDSLLQGIFAMNKVNSGGNGQSWVLVAIKQIALYGRLPARCYAHVRVNPQDNPETMQCDIDIVSPSGEILVAMKQLQSRVLASGTAGNADKAVSSTPDIATSFYQAKWQQRLLVDTTLQTNMTGTVLWLGRNNSRFALWQQSHTASQFADVCQNTAAYQQLFADCVDLCAVVVDVNSLFDACSDVAERAQQSLQSITMLCQAISQRQHATPLRLLCFYDKVAQEHGASYAALHAFLSSCHKEYIPIQGQLIEFIEHNEADSNQALYNEFHHAVDSVWVRYQEKLRYTHHFVEADKQDAMTDATTPFHQGGVYLLTGGLGGLGQIIARYLAARYQATLILVGRRQLSELGQQQLAAINELGGKASYYQADISQRDAVKALIKDSKQTHKRLDGIIHLAGILRDSRLVDKTTSDINAVLSAKVAGLMHLDELTQGEPLACFIGFSSLAGALGNVGQTDYAYANAFMDRYLSQRAAWVKAGKRQGKTISINWPLWKEGGMQVDKATEQYMVQQLGIMPLTTDEGTKAFEQIVSQDSVQQLVLPGTTSGKAKLLAAGLPARQPRNNQQKSVTKTALANASESDLAVYLEADMKQLVFDVLKLPVEKIDLHAPLNDYGLDSIMMTELTNRINDYFSLDLTPAVWFTQTSLQGFIDYLAQEHAEELTAHYAAKQPKTTKEMPVSLSPAVLQASSSLQQASVVNPVVNKVSIQPARMSEQPAITRRTHANEPIAIIGMHGVFAQSKNLSEFWQHLLHQHDLISEVPKARWDWQAVQQAEGEMIPKWGGFMDDVDKFDAAFFNLSPKEVELMDPQQRLMLEATWQTLEDAGYTVAQLQGSDTSVFIGVSATDYPFLLERSGAEILPYTPTGNGHSVLANRLSYYFDWHGASEPIDTACSCSLIAVHRAIETLRAGHSQLALVGGVNAMLTPDLYIAFGRRGC